MSIFIFCSFWSFFWGLKKLEKKPTGQEVTGPSSLARSECIPVRCKAFCCSPDTTTRSITAGSRIVWLVPAPYNASIHPSCFPPDWHPDKWFNLNRAGSTFSPPNTFLAGQVTGDLPTPGRTGHEKFFRLDWESAPAFLTCCISECLTGYSQSFTNSSSNIRTEHVGRSSRPSRRGHSVVVCSLSLSSVPHASSSIECNKAAVVSSSCSLSSSSFV